MRPQVIRAHCFIAHDTKQGDIFAALAASRKPGHAGHAWLEVLSRRIM